MRGHIRNRGTKDKEAWQYIFYIYQNGNRRCISKSGFKTYDLAEKALIETLSNYYKFNYTPNNSLTFSDIALDYINVYIKENKPLSTFKKYTSNYNKYLYPLLGSLKLKNINTSTINNTLYKIKNLNKDKPLSSTTLKSIFALINAIFNRALKLDLILKNPCRNADKITTKPYIPEIFTTFEIESLFSLLDLSNYRDFLTYSCIKIALQTGVRRGELAGLTWNQIDFNSNSISISNTLSYVDGHTVFNTNPKTKSSLRKIDISDDLKLLFLELKRQSEYYKSIYKNKYKECYFNNKPFDFVFRHQDGQVIHPMWIYNRLKYLIKKSNLNPKLNFHSLRHTFASLFLIYNNGDLATLSSLLGHCDKAFTFKKYCHFIPGNSKNTINNLSVAIPSKVIKPDPLIEDSSESKSLYENILNSNPKENTTKIIPKKDILKIASTILNTTLSDSDKDFLKSLVNTL